ncbi:MAG: hypothetical protein U0M06_13625 [Clostridia bacterium]|nr:hypothetical protein [Clostridia bacterium]
MIYYGKPMRKSSSFEVLLKASRRRCECGRSGRVNGLSRADRGQCGKLQTVFAEYAE